MFDEEFRNSIEMLRELGDEIFEHTGDVMDIESLPPIVKMMRRYDFPSGMLRFLVVFNKENRVDFTLIDSSMFVVSEMDATATGSDVSMEINYRRYIDISTVQNRYKHRPELKLVISPNASLNEIKDFIDQNWSTFIKPKQELYKGLVSTPEVIRDRKSAEIHHEAKNYRREGRTYAEIAGLLNERFNKMYSYKEVQRMVERLELDS
jgi:hypothetical protein